MRALLSAGIAGIFLCLSALAAHSQSLEESYAELCTDPAKAKGEACQALAGALIAKLQSHSGSPATGPSRAAGKAGPDASAATRDASPSAVDAEQSALWRKRWGLYLDMIGKDWMVAPVPEREYEANMRLLEGNTMSYRWTLPGVEFELNVLDSVLPKSTVRWDESRQRMVVQDGGEYVAEADGTIVGLEQTTALGTTRSRTTRLLDGSIQSVLEMKEGDAWRVYTTGRLLERTPERVAQERQKLLAAEQQRLAQEQARQQEEQQRRQEEQQRRQKRGQMLGSLLIAGVGAATVTAYGGSTEQVVGGALKGLQIANPENPTAGALGDLSGTLLSGVDSSSIAPGGSGGGAASYPIEPPVNLGEACAGFTESNYRALAVQAPGDDAHLYAACGQAFELYQMYLNAVRQGYSQAEAMRTYQAHQGAAANAVDYYRTRRAN